MEWERRAKDGIKEEKEKTHRRRARVKVAEKARMVRRRRKEDLRRYEGGVGERSVVVESRCEGDAIREALQELAEKTIVEPLDIHDLWEFLQLNPSLK